MKRKDKTIFYIRKKDRKHENIVGFVVSGAISP